MIRSSCRNSSILAKLKNQNRRAQSRTSFVRRLAVREVRAWRRLELGIDIAGERSDALRKPVGRSEVEVLLSEEAVGPSRGDIAGLLRMAIDNGGAAEAVLDRLDHLMEGDRLAVAEVYHGVRAAMVFDDGADAGDDVGDVGVVSSGAAVAKHRDLLPVENHTREFVDREVRPLARAVNGEEAQSDEADAVKVAIDVAEQLATDLGTCKGLIGMSAWSSSRHGTRGF